MSQRAQRPADPGIGSLAAPIGSESWAQAMRLNLQSRIAESKSPPKAILSTITTLLKHESWHVLNKRDGSYFSSFEEFCAAEQPYGLGMTAEQVRHLIESSLAPTDISLDKAKQIPVHPACEVFPMLEEKELGELAHDIKANGLIQPIVLLRLEDERVKFGTSFKVTRHWQILDGRNRLRACELAGVTPHFVEWQGHGDPTAWVISTNLHRRHLTDSQRSMAAARARETVFAPAARERQIASGHATQAKLGHDHDPGKVSANWREPSDGKASEEAAAALNVSTRNVERAAKILKDGVPELIAAVDSGEVAVSSAAEVSRLPAEEQRAVVAAGPKAVKETAKAQVEARKKQASRPRPVQPKAKDAPPSAPISSSVRDALESKGATAEQLVRVGALDEASQREVAKLAVGGLAVTSALERVDVPTWWRDAVARAARELGEQGRQGALDYATRVLG